MNRLLVRRNGALQPQERATAEALFRRGAILTLAAAPGQHFLAGAMRWHEDSGAFFFVAFGDGEHDAHYLRIDALAEDRDGCIRFFGGNEECAKLEEIAAAAVEDPEDYRIAWTLWQQVVPLRQALVDRCFAALVADGEARASSPERLDLAPRESSFSALRMSPAATGRTQL